MKQTIYSIGRSVFAILGFAILAFAQERPEILSSTEFFLTDAQEAAGIDGRLKISLDVDEKGAVTDAEVIAGPIYPCNFTPKTELDEFKAAAVRNARTFRFMPTIKDGKPTKSVIVLTVTVGKAYKASLEAKSGKGLEVIDAGIVNGRAISLPKPSWPGGNATGGSVSVDVMINPQGVVTSAGTFTGPKQFHKAAREAACEARFSPTLKDGRPIMVTGRITYNFSPR